MKLKKPETQIYQEVPSNQTILISLESIYTGTRHSIKNFKAHFLQYLLLNISSLTITISGCFIA